MRVLLNRWWRSVQLAARLGWYDAKRHRVSSLVVLLILVVPTTWAFAGLTWQHVNSAGQVHRYGTAQAVLDQEHTPAKTFAQQESFLSQVTGRQVVSWQQGAVRVHGVPQPLVRVTSGADLGPKLRLLDGRWPTSPDEILVTAAGQDLGMPDSGTYRTPEFSFRGKTYPAEEFTVVGTAAALTTGVAPVAVGVLTPDAALPEQGVRWFVTGAQPVSAAAKQMWEANNLAVDHPVIPNVGDDLVGWASMRYLPTTAFWQNLGIWAMTITIYAVYGGLAVGLAGLLLAPAFTIVAARQQRQLANVARSGATKTRLAQVVIVQGLTFGAVAVLVSALLAGGWLWWRVSQLTPAALPGGQLNTTAPWALWGLLALVVLLVCAVSAWWPAASVDRYGQVTRATAFASTGPMRRPVVGRQEWVLAGTFAALAVGLTIVGVVLLRSGGMTGKVMYVAMMCLLVGGVFVGVCGLVLIRPVLFGIVGQAHRLPMLGRLAFIDTARHNARTLGVVVAAASATSLMVAFLLVTGSFDDHSAEHTLPVAVTAGDVVVYPTQQHSPLAQDQPVAVDFATFLANRSGELRAAEVSEPWVVDADSRRWVSVSAAACGVQDMSCRTGRAHWSEPGSKQLLLAPKAHLVQRFGLSATQADQVAAGAVLVPEGLFGDAAVQVQVMQQVHSPGEPNPVEVTGKSAVQVVSVPVSAANNSGRVVYAAAESDWGVPAEYVAQVVYRADGQAVSRTQRAEVHAALASLRWSTSSASVLSGAAIVTWALAGVLVLFLSLTVVLNAMQTRRTRDVLTALGGTVTSTRFFVACQAVLLAGVGTWCGAVIGLIAPSPVLLLMQGPVDGEGLLRWQLPGWQLVVFCVLVPLVCAVLAALVTPTPRQGSEFAIGSQER